VISIEGGLIKPARAWAGGSD